MRAKCVPERLFITSLCRSHYSHKSDQCILSHACSVYKVKLHIGDPLSLYFEKLLFHEPKDTQRE